MRQPLEAVLLGAGNRGYRSQGMYAQRYPHRLRYVAVAEPDPTLRDRFGQLHDIPPERRYANWEDLLAAGQLAPALVNTTPDHHHLASTLTALEAGYDVLLEKPMATSPAECARIVRSAEERGRILQINHGLRYAPFFALVREQIEAGRLGEIMSYQHTENVTYWHMAHSYVRGNWRNTALAAPMILTKCCHDLDLMVWYTGSRSRRIASFGSLRHFRPDGLDASVPERCIDGCPREMTCPYYAPRLYVSEEPSRAFIRWAASAEESQAALLAAMRAGPYGRCVYRCDNDVVDCQTVLVEFEDGTNATLTMQGFSMHEGRQLRLDGTRASLQGDARRGEVEVEDHLTGRRDLLRPGQTTGGHGGGDDRLMTAFIESVQAGRQEAATSARVALESHLMAFAAEESRLTGRVVDMDEYRRRFE